MNKIISVLLALTVCFCSLGFSANALSTDRSNYIFSCHYRPDFSENEKRPAVIWANGTYCPTFLYTKLISILTENGYIVFTTNDTMAGDGKSLAASLDYLFKTNEDEASPLYHRIDTENIGAVGHSQGGRGVVVFASSEDRIKCVVSISGSSYKSEAEKLSAPTLFLTGTTDFVVLSSFWVKPAFDLCQGPAVYSSLKFGFHVTPIFNPGRISGYILDWCDYYLKNNTDALRSFAPDGKMANDRHWTGFEAKILPENI